MKRYEVPAGGSRCYQIRQAVGALAAVVTVYAYSNVEIAVDCSFDGFPLPADLSERNRWFVTAYPDMLVADIPSLRGCGEYGNSLYEYVGTSVHGRLYRLRSARRAAVKQ
jgi:hypothetical protein